MLLILAGVSISLLAGGDGILKKATDAVDTNTIATVKEEIDFKIAEVLIDYYEDIYVKKDYSVNTSKTQYIEEKCATGVTSSGYNFEISDGVVTVFVTETNGLKEDIVGTLLASGNVYWDDELPVFTVTYDANSGEGDVPVVANVALGKSVTVDFATLPTKEGYIFLGWATTAEATSAEYTADGTTSFAMPEKDVTLYAVWKIEIPEGLAVGATVTYTPSGIYSEWTTDNSGYSTAYSLASGKSYTDSSTQTDMTISSWKVFNIDETTGEVELVPSSPTSNSVGLYGADGYNNAVKLLNDACSSLYSDTAKEITARSINIKDIESVLDYDPTTYIYVNDEVVVNYGEQYTTAYTSNKTYPVIYAEEIDSVIDGVKNTSGLGLSEYTSDWLTGTATATTSIRPIQTYYYLDYNNFSTNLNDGYSEILLPNMSSTNYWIASRSVSLYQSYADFGVRRVDEGGPRAYSLFDSDLWPTGNAHPLFPVVSLSSEVIEGSAETGWSVK